MSREEAMKKLSRIASRVTSASGPIASEIGRAVLANGEDGQDDTSMNPEGDLSVSDGEVISVLQKWLTAKYAIDMAYRSYADRLHGPWRDSLVDHWHDHAKEERSAAYDIAMKIVGMGADPNVTMVQVPAATPSLELMMTNLMKLELEAIATGREIVRMAGGRQSLRVMAENLLLVDTQHLDDLRRMFPMAGG
jgi:bacterioferritin (cytochrome b1)